MRNFAVIGCWIIVLLLNAYVICFIPASFIKPRIEIIKTTEDLLNISLHWPSKIIQQIRHDINLSRINLLALRDIFNLCSNSKSKMPVKFEDSSFIINQPNYCLIHQNLTLLIAVHSHPSNIHRRNIIRGTWSSLSRIKQYKIGTLFFLGRAKNKNEQKLIEQENDYYQDIIQRDFVENYYNMTRKHITIMEWLTNGRCESIPFLVKVDDDTFVDVFHLIRLIESQASMLKQGFYCSATSNAIPVRPGLIPKSKWEISKEEFPDRVFPTYCEGFGYIMPVSLAPYLYYCSMFKSFMWIDDVYVTGILTQSLGINRKRFIPGHSYGRVQSAKLHGSIVDYIFLTCYYSEYLPTTFINLWHKCVYFSMNAN